MFIDCGDIELITADIQVVDIEDDACDCASDEDHWLAFLSISETQDRLVFAPTTPDLAYVGTTNLIGLDWSVEFYIGVKDRDYLIKEDARKFTGTLGIAA